MNHIELNALTADLNGKALIEASAGTGKTFTIATLYIRLLLGQGDNAFHRPLSVTEILVVTFTEAATEELRDRIRTRIRETKIAMLRGHTTDPVISQVLEATEDKDVAAKILAIAEQQMDESSIYTIHGFCQRMLKQYTIDTNSMESATLVTDEDKLRGTVVADFWRKHITPLREEVAAEVRKCWKTPDALKSDISRYMSGSAISVKSEEKNLGKSIVDVYEQSILAIENLKQQWIDAANSDDLIEILTSSDINKRSWTKKRIPERLNQIHEWSRDAYTDLTLPPALELFSQKTLNEQTKEGGSKAVHQVFSEIEDYFDERTEMKGELFKIAIRECRLRYRETKGDLALMSFDDLLVNLEKALTSHAGGHLAKQIKMQYPFAMIDEFQDTDALQFNIFLNIYSSEDTSCDYGLFMIGDPKQAIYAFRGADINTYIAAKKNVDKVYTLSKNWRSTHEMVSATNDIFTLSENPFLHNDDIAFIETSSAASPDSSIWTVNGQRMSALNVWSIENDGKPVLKSDYELTLANYTADEILTLLTDQTSTLSSKGVSRRVESGDIAILVRTGRQAKIIQQALEKRNIASVYLSSSGSVYDTTEARDLLLTLRALVNLKDERAIRAAITSSLFGYTAQELDQLNKDEKKWEKLLAELTVYSKTWTFNGVSAAIRKLVTNRELPKKLLTELGGERTLTNLLHLAELLQAEEQSIDSELSIIQTLENHISNPNNNSEEQQLRLESDENLVKVVTIHKSKGLEYNLVFLPFAVSYQETTTPLFYDPNVGKMVLDVENKDSSLELAEKERLAEDLRILYVAMTRAVFGTYIGLCPIQYGRRTKGDTGLHKSGLGFLLQKGNEAEADYYTTFLNDFVETSAHTCLRLPPSPSVDRLTEELSQRPPLKDMSKLTNPVEKDWWITSFSSLSRHAHSHEDNAFATAAIASELFNPESEAKKDDGNLELDIFSFPKGAAIGTFLHTIFEEIDYTKTIRNGDNYEILKSLMESNDIDEKWTETLCKLIEDILTKPLNDEGFQLSSLTDATKLVEMEFLIPISHLSHIKFNKLMSIYEPLYKQGHQLGFDDVQGLLKGFIDLTFVDNGKYYVLDWKSNHLGNDHDHYTYDAMGAAIADHRYDVQYTLYTLALHRFLSSKLPDYDYDKHIGGCYYVFLRGVNEVNLNGVFFSKPKRELIERLDAYFAEA